MERVQEAIALYLEVEGDSASEPDFVGVQVVAVEAEAISPQPPGAPLAHAAAERPRKFSYSVTMDLLQRISIDPAVRFGKPCVRGTRLTVGDVLGVLAAGRAEAELLLDFPQLTHEDVLACLAFAAEREKRLITSAAAV
jgi:uncharacterized protein (DUF433 family)